VAAGRDFNMPFLTNLTKHAVYKSDNQYRFIPEVAKVTVPLSWPGPTTAASQQVWDLYIIPDMLAQYATGKMSVDQAIAWGKRRCRRSTRGFSKLKKYADRLYPFVGIGTRPKRR
jgi:multiple sugar transport system substrate-binding protein